MSEKTHGGLSIAVIREQLLVADSLFGCAVVSSLVEEISRLAARVKELEAEVKMFAEARRKWHE